MSTSAVGETSTVPEGVDGLAHRWEQGLRYATKGLLGLAVALSLLGVLGVRTTTVAAEEGGYHLEVLHASVTRGGLATPFQVTVSRQGGLPEQVTLRLSSEYLAMFDQNRVDPEPSDSYADGTWTSWTFSVPAGESVLRVDLDATLEPAVQWGKDGEVAVMESGSPVTTVRIRTWVAP